MWHVTYSNTQKHIQFSLKPIYYFSWPTAQCSYVFPTPSINTTTTTSHTKRVTLQLHNVIRTNERTIYRIPIGHNRHMLNPLSSHKITKNTRSRRKNILLENKNIQDFLLTFVLIFSFSFRSNYTFCFFFCFLLSGSSSSSFCSNNGVFLQCFQLFTLNSLFEFVSCVLKT